MTPQSAIAAVSLATGTPEDFITSDARTVEAVRCRLMVMHLLKQARPLMSPLSLSHAVNRVDVQTGRDGLKRAQELIASEPDFAATLERANQHLQPTTS